MFASLEEAHGRLAERLEAEGLDKLLARLEPAPPAPRARGYGLLPEIGSDPPARHVDLRQTRYSLEWLSRVHATDVRDAALLASRVERARPDELEGLVTELERLQARLRNLEEHLDYHRFWQQSVLDHAEFFARRNELVARAVELDELVRAGAEPERRRELRREISEAVAPFEPTPGLALERDAAGGARLVLPLVTDVEDEAFLDRFEREVEAAWSESEAARARGFRLDVRFERIAPEELYDGRPPARGSAIDENDHLARFPAGALVLTTGGASTHARIGRYVQLGSEPATPRKLAHELGHLLGFGDAYLRGYEGDPDDPFGVVLVEWVGLQDDLMGSPGRGLVGAAMVDRLLEAYAAPESEASTEASTAEVGAGPAPAGS